MPETKSEPGTVIAKITIPEIEDTRVIKSNGKYNVDEELAAEEYPADFVRSSARTGRKKMTLRMRPR